MYLLDWPYIATALLLRLNSEPRALLEEVFSMPLTIVEKAKHIETPEIPDLINQHSRGIDDIRTTFGPIERIEKQR